MGGITRLLLLLWAGVTVSTVVDLQKRIIGGRDCRDDERPYHVLVETTDGTNWWFCGGSLINSQWILTAEHCQKPGRTIYATLGVHPGPGTQVQITAPPETYIDNGITHDIMLLKLPNPDPTTQPVPLPRCNDRPRVNDAVQIAGYASDTTGPNNRRVPGRVRCLKCAETTVVNCQRLRQLNPQWQHEHWVCGQRARVDVCKGDSGGGVVYKGKIYGVISLTGNPTHACQEAAGFMDVCAYEQWITNTINRP